MSKHSPGPWKWAGTDGRLYDVNLEAVPRSDEDRRLISAAPEMLDLLRKAEWLDTCDAEACDALLARIDGTGT